MHVFPLPSSVTAMCMPHAYLFYSFSPDVSSHAYDNQTSLVVSYETSFGIISYELVMRSFN